MNTLSKGWCAFRKHPYGVRLYHKNDDRRIWYTCKHCNTTYSEPWTRPWHARLWEAIWDRP